MSATKNSKSRKKRMLLGFFASYPDTAFVSGREASAAVIADVLDEISPWALEQALSAFGQATKDGLSDPSYWPSAPLLLAHAERWDEAKLIFSGDQLVNVMGRLRVRAIAAMPTTDQVRDATQQIEAENARLVASHAHTRERAKGET